MTSTEYLFGVLIFCVVEPGKPNEVDIPEELDSGRMILMFGPWKTGRLDSLRLESGQLDAWTLNAWILDAWTLDVGLGTLEPRKFFPYLVIPFPSYYLM